MCVKIVGAYVISVSMVKYYINGKKSDKKQEDTCMEQDKVVELLEDIKKSNNRDMKYQRVSMVLMLIFVVAVLALIPSIVSTLDTAKATLLHMNDAITQIETALDSVETALESVDELTAEGELAMQGMEEALQKVNQFDIETLNGAIKDLSEVVEPMAKFFNVFNR